MTNELRGYCDGYSDGRIDILRELRQNLNDEKDLSIVKDIIDDKIKDWEKNNAEIREEKTGKCEWIKYDHRTMCPKEHDKERKYYCKIWFTREESFYVNATYEKVAKVILGKIATEKKKHGEEITGKYIHEVYNK